MNISKKFTSAILVALFTIAACINMKADNVDVRVISSGTTNTVAAVSTNTYTLTSKVGNSMGISIYTKFNSANAAVYAMTLTPSDGTNISTVSGQVITLPPLSAAGTNSAGILQYVTNVTVGALAQYSLKIANTNDAVAPTNLLIKTYSK